MVVSVSSDDVLYDYLPGEEENPLMESTFHVQWGHLLIGAVGHALAGTNALVTGNVRWDRGDGGARVAPDLMVIPGYAGHEFGVFRPGPEGPTPSACVEILSPSNRGARFEARLRRMLDLGVPEVYVVDPVGQRVAQIMVADDGQLVEHDALGVASPALGITFGRTGEGLVVCCPAGRVVSPGDDPYSWVVEGEARRREAEEQADVARERAEAESLRAEAERDRADAEHRRAEAEHRRAEAERDRADAAEQRADQEHQRAEAAERVVAAERRAAETDRERLAAAREQLRAQGITPEF